MAAEQHKLEKILKNSKKGPYFEFHNAQQRCVALNCTAVGCLTFKINVRASSECLFLGFVPWLSFTLAVWQAASSLCDFSSTFLPTLGPSLHDLDA